MGSTTDLPYRHLVRDRQITIASLERLELRYTGITNWLFYFEGEWEEEWGHVDEFQTMNLIEPSLNKDTNSLDQKYTIGANWYPTMRLNLSGQYYHKIASYSDDIITAQFPRLINQDWNTDDLNVRLTFRPRIPARLGTLAMVTRYDFVPTTIDGQWGVFSDGELLAEQETGKIKRHVITEAINWNPLARFFCRRMFPTPSTKRTRPRTTSIWPPTPALQSRTLGTIIGQ